MFHYFVIFNLFLLSPSIFYCKMCNCMLMSNPKMSDICWGNGDIYVDPQNLPLILYYFRSCLEATELLETSDKQNLLETLSNRIGSVLSQVKYEYYGGNIDYDIIENLNDLVNEIKFMEISYNEPRPYPYQCQSRYDYNMGSAYNYINDRMYRSPHIMKASPLKITTTLEDQIQACSSLILKNKTSGNKTVSNINSFKSKDYVDKIIPVPVLNVVNQSPRSIAVPLKGRSIYPVNGKDSRDILIRYYVTSMKCLSLNSHPKQDIFDFNENFCHWLEKEAVPKILLHQYYPAFGGVFQILETMRSKGMAKDCIDRINKKQAVMTKRIRGKEFHIASYMDNATRATKTDSKANQSDLLDYVDLLQTMVPVVGASFVGTQSSITTNQNTGPLIMIETRATTVANASGLGLGSRLKKVVDASPKYVLLFVAFLVATLLATCTLASSLCLVHLRDHEKWQDSYSAEFQPEPAESQGDSCPYGAGDSVVFMIEDEKGHPRHYHGILHWDKSKIPQNGCSDKQDNCDSWCSLKEISCDQTGPNICSKTCYCDDAVEEPQKTSSSTDVVSGTSDVETTSEEQANTTNSSKEKDEPDKMSTEEDSGSSKPQIGSEKVTDSPEPVLAPKQVEAPKPVPKCPCPCSKGEEHYNLCHSKSTVPHSSKNSLLLDQSFAPKKSKMESLEGKESISQTTNKASASNLSQAPQNADTYSIDTTASQANSVGDTSETAESRSIGSIRSTTISPQGSQQKFKDSKKKEQPAKRASIDTSTVKKSRGKK